MHKARHFTQKNHFSNGNTQRSEQIMKPSNKKNKNILRLGHCWKIRKLSHKSVFLVLKIGVFFNNWERKLACLFFGSCFQVLKLLPKHSRTDGGSTNSRKNYDLKIVDLRCLRQHNIHTVSEACIMILTVTFFCSLWACSQFVHDVIVLFHADLLYGKFQTFVKYYKNRAFCGVFTVKSIEC